MKYQSIPYKECETYRRLPVTALLALSILFHIFFLVIIPIMSTLFHNRRKFERPKTFQLVASPFRPSPPSRAPLNEEARKQRMPQEEKKTQPRQLPDPNARRATAREAQKEKEAARPKENLNELASILNEIPAPASVAAIGNFKYHWYLNNVQQKLERFWNPPSENRSLRVVVSFIIYQDGTISEPSIVNSSGNGTLDNLALRAVKLAAPFGKLPPGFEGNRLELNCTLIPTRK